MSPAVRPSIEAIEAARRCLEGVVRDTPLLPVGGSGVAATELLVKPEQLQPSGSFKIRGVHHAVSRLTDEQRGRGVSTVSAGNTAKALAWSARRFGIRARSLMPEHAPRTKIDAFRALGGEPILRPADQLFRFLDERQWESEPYSFVHPWIEPDVLIGHGTLGLEIAAQCEDLDSVFIPVGGGGLLAGVASALKAVRPEIRIRAVEPAGCPALEQALAAGRPVTVGCDTICDGVAVPFITDELFPLLAELVEDVILVGEDEVRAAIRRLCIETHLVVEASGALAAAAAWKLDPVERGRSVALLTGGSIDPEQLAAILA